MRPRGHVRPSAGHDSRRRYLNPDGKEVSFQAGNPSLRLFASPEQLNKWVKADEDILQLCEEVDEKTRLVRGIMGEEAEFPDKRRAPASTPSPRHLLPVGTCTIPWPRTSLGVNLLWHYM